MSIPGGAGTTSPAFGTARRWPGARPTQPPGRTCPRLRANGGRPDEAPTRGESADLPHKPHNAAFHLTRAGLLEAPSFGATRISPRGRQVLDEHQTLNLGIVASIASERADEAAQEEAGDAADELSPEEAMKASMKGSELVWPKRSWPGSWRKARPFSSASCSTSSSGWVTGDHGKLRQSTSDGSQTVVSMVSSARTRSARTFSMCRPSVMRVSGQSASIRSTNSSAPFRHTECAEAF